MSMNDQMRKAMGQLSHLFEDLTRDREGNISIEIVSKMKALLSVLVLGITDSMTQSQLIMT